MNRERGALWLFYMFKNDILVKWLYKKLSLFHCKDRNLIRFLSITDIKLQSHAFLFKNSRVHCKPMPIITKQSRGKNYFNRHLIFMYHSSSLLGTGWEWQESVSIGTKKTPRSSGFCCVKSVLLVSPHNTCSLVGLKSLFYSLQYLPMFGLTEFFGWTKVFNLQSIVFTNL